MTEPGPSGQRIRVAVLFGGRSSEHAISCVTAAGVLGAIDRERYDVLPIGITRDGQWVQVDDATARSYALGQERPEVQPSTRTVVPLQSGDRGELVLSEPAQVPHGLGEVDVVLPLLHGPFGEDGTIQGLLELLNLPYVGAGVLASAVGMDKGFMKAAFAQAGLPIGPYQTITDRQWMTDRDGALDRVRGLGLPVFVKPARAGSSVGITRVDDDAALADAIEAAREHDPRVVVEAGIEGREIECAVLDGAHGEAPRVSLPGEIVVADSAHTFYDFEAKYVDSDAAQLSCPAELPDGVVAQMQEMAVRVFEAIGAEGLSRVDFFYTNDGELIVNEINTMPGFTPISMYPRLWAASGVEYPDLIDRLIRLALARRTGLR